MNRFGDIDCSFKKLSPVYGFRVEKVVSLEKALEPIQAHIDQLSYFIKIAQKSCCHPNKHGLSKDQSASIYIYTMEWGDTTLYRVLNQALRSENRPALKIWFPYLKLFDSALDLLPTVKESVWRGVPLDIGKNFTKNQIFTWWPVSSCSSSVDVIEQFLQNKSNSTLFLIEIVNGKKVSGYTEYENEDEVILRIGTEFRVKSNPLKRADGSHTVHLIEIEEENEDEHHNDQQPLATPMKSLDVKPKPSIKMQSDQTTSPHPQLKPNLYWKHNANTVAGGNGQGDKFNQLSSPFGIYVDHQQHSLYVADRYNQRIVRWKLGENNGQVVAGGNGRGDRIDQLNEPTDVIVDENNKSLIICDRGSRRVVRWSLENAKDKQILIHNILCWGLVMNEHGDLFVSDHEKKEVKRWRKGEKEGTIVAGGNGEGTKLNQLHCPTFLFVDGEETVYVSDCGNDRVMKWKRGAKEGIVVAGGQGKGESLKQLSGPCGLIVNAVGDVYVADALNHRIMCWASGSKEGRVVVGGNGKGQRSNQLNYPRGLSFDVENRLYVVDEGNHRVQRFDVGEK